MPKIHETYYLTDLLRNYTEVAEDANYMAIRYHFINVDDSNTETLDYLKKRNHFGNAILDNTFLPMKYISKIVPEDMANNYGEESRHKGMSMDYLAWNIPGELLASYSANWHKDSRSMNVGDVILDHTPDDYPATKVPYLVVEHKGEICLIGFVMGSYGNDEFEECGFDDGEYVNPNSEAINPIIKQKVLLDVSRGIVM